MVSIDTVYQRVLVLANKEQRGYITPQEFNLLANQAQMEIFEQYFGDLVVYNKNPGNTQEFSDPLSVLYEKIGEFDVDLDMSISYTMRPPDVQWAYVVVNDKALYNDNISVDFELHASEETELVYKILKLAGVNLKAQDLAQAAGALEQVNKQTTL
jgi:hypothetical protein